MKNGTIAQIRDESWKDTLHPGLPLSACQFGGLSSSSINSGDQITF